MGKLYAHASVVVTEHRVTVAAIGRYRAYIGQMSDEAACDSGSRRRCGAASLAPVLLPVPDHVPNSEHLGASPYTVDSTEGQPSILAR